MDIIRATIVIIMKNNIDNFNNNGNEDNRNNNGNSNDDNDNIFS